LGWSHADTSHEKKRAGEEEVDKKTGFSSDAPPGRAQMAWLGRPLEIDHIPDRPSRLMKLSRVAHENPSTRWMKRCIEATRFLYRVQSARYRGKDSYPQITQIHADEDEGKKDRSMFGFKDLLNLNLRKSA